MRLEKNKREKAPDGKMALGLSLPLWCLMQKDAEAFGSRNVFPRLAAKQFATLLGKLAKSRAVRLYGPSCQSLNWSAVESIYFLPRLIFPLCPYCLIFNWTRPENIQIKGTYRYIQAHYLCLLMPVFSTLSHAVSVRDTRVLETYVEWTSDHGAGRHGKIFQHLASWWEALKTWNRADRLPHSIEWRREGSWLRYRYSTLTCQVSYLV